MITFIAIIVSIIGALNWLLVGIIDFNFVSWLLGAGSVAARVVYALVGVAGVWLIGYLIKRGKQIIVAEDKTVQ